MTRFGPRRSPSCAAVISVVLSLAPGVATAQALDCSALRAAIDAAAPSADDPARADAAMRRQRDEILRTRDDANRTGCGDGFFDDSDSLPCRSLARRIGMLQVGLQRLQDRAARDQAVREGLGEDAEDRRRDLQARFDAQCSADRADAGDAPTTVAPVDPDAPPGPAAKPRASRVLCVRHCDGAFYPLATDVATDRMGDMDRICQAQCPSAESSAYAGGDGDVADATATDGSAYSALPAAFAFLKGSPKACSCRAPHQSWAEALAGAEALLQPHKGDVTVTAELASAMARPAPVPPKPTPPGARAGAAVPPASSMQAAPKPAKPAKAKRPSPLTVPAPPSGLDITREFRGSDPTL